MGVPRSKRICWNFYLHFACEKQKDPKIQLTFCICWEGVRFLSCSCPSWNLNHAGGQLSLCRRASRRGVFFQVGEASGQTWRCSEPRVTQRFLRVNSDLKLANVPPESSTQGLLALRAWDLNLEKNWSRSPQSLTFQIRFCMLGPYRSIYFGPWLALLKDVGLDRKRQWPVKRGPSFSSFKYSFNFKAFKLMRSTNKHTASYSYNTYISRKSKQILSWAPSVFFLFDLGPHPNRNACNSRASGPCTRAWTVRGCLCIASSLAFAAGRHGKLRVGRVPARFAASGNQGWLLYQPFVVMSLLDQISCALPPVELWLGHCIVSLCLSIWNGISSFMVRQRHGCGAAPTFVASVGDSLAYGRLFHHIFLGTFAEVRRIILDRSSLYPPKELAEENTDTSSSSWNHSAVISDVGRLGWDLLSKTVVQLRCSAWFVTCVFLNLQWTYPFLSCNSGKSM